MPGPTAATAAGAAKLEKLAKSVRTGGKGSVRRKKKVVAHTSGGASQKLDVVLKKQGLQPISGVEEVNFFAADTSVFHFSKPKVQANFQANTYVIKGNGESKHFAELMPNIVKQMNMNDIEQLKRLVSQAGAAGAGAGDDDDVPDLVENFEKASE
eukprot:GILI01010737.1.p2 GENE.GILI01010737.1~~GILI01010737.1.p2  ORF type:complete len:165 (-),score=62.84 GILI01010737.1:31-495(-)